MLMFHELKHAAQFLHWSKRQLEINLGHVLILSQKKKSLILFYDVLGY